jgi:hypothetical protein
MLRTLRNVAAAAGVGWVPMQKDVGCRYGIFVAVLPMKTSREERQHVLVMPFAAELNGRPVLSTQPFLMALGMLRTIVLQRIRHAWTPCNIQNGRVI